MLGSRGIGEKRRRIRSMRRGFTSKSMLPMTNADDVPANANFGLILTSSKMQLKIALSMQTASSPMKALS